MASPDWLTEGFENNRGRLRAVAYRMLGSLAEADDAVQEAWLRVARADASEVDNLSAWLTTIVARVCLNSLRSRNARREEPLDTHVPDPVITRADGLDTSNSSNSSNPEEQALLADSVGLALQVVLETLTPAERLAFVLHDTFGLPFEEIAPMLGRSPAAARQLASRARRRVRGADVHSPDRDIARQREVVDAFFAAAHGGDFDALVAVLDPDVVSRVDAGAGALIPSGVLHGAATVARQTLAIASISAPKHPVLVNGAAGVVITLGGQPVSVMSFTVSGGKIVEMNSIVDPERLRQFDFSVLDS
jgi:RNA polymerase sigma-70 factor, ECF subfamily